MAELYNYLITHRNGFSISQLPLITKFDEHTKKRAFQFFQNHRGYVIYIAARFNAFAIWTQFAVSFSQLTTKIYQFDKQTTALISNDLVNFEIAYCSSANSAIYMMASTAGHWPRWLSIAHDYHWQQKYLLLKSYEQHGFNLKHMNN